MTLLIASAAWSMALFSDVPFRQTIHGPREVNAVALTFDDGPSLATLDVLEILDEYDIKATFFMVGGNIRQMPDVAAQVASRGHEVGAHSDNHSRWLPYQLPRRSIVDTAASVDAIEEAIGVRPRLYRPPHGRSSPWMRWAVLRQGGTITGWDVHGSDWKNRSPEQIAQEVLKKAQPGSIILLHDGLDLHTDPDRSAMISALPLIVEGLTGRGFELVTVSELLSL